MKEYTVRESDKFICIFTKSNGKLMVNAPYAKRHNRGLASATEVFVYGQFVIQENRGNYKLIQVDIIEPFHNLRKDLFKLAYGAYILEFIDVTMEENLASANVLRLVIRTFQAMCSGAIKESLIRHIFELKHMCLIGFMPNVFNCNICNKSYKEIDHLCFDISEGGLVCGNCCDLEGAYCHKISRGTLRTMQYIVSVHIDDLFKFTVTDEILNEYGQIITDYIDYYINKKFKTLEFIKDIETI